MPGLTGNYSLGLQVEIGKMDKERKKLWQDGEGAMTRASLINLAVYSEARGSLEKNTQLIARITESHARRALVIYADCAAKAKAVDDGLREHRHIRLPGQRQ